MSLRVRVRERERVYALHTTGQVLLATQLVAQVKLAPYIESKLDVVGYSNGVLGVLQGYSRRTSNPSSTWRALICRRVYAYCV
jgi:hypothetical protein